MLRKRRVSTVLILLCVPYISFADNSVSHASPRLKQFITEVWQTNPQIQAAESNVMAAQFQATAQNQSLYNPDLNADTNRTDTTNYSVGVSQTLDLSGKRRARSKVGCANLQMAKTQLQVSRLQLGTQALAALATYYTDKKLVSLAEQRTELLQQFAHQITKKYKVGDLSKVQLDEANMALAEAISREATAKMTFSHEQQTLVAITGTASRTWPTLANTLPHQPHLENEEQLLTHLPAVALLNQQVEKSRAAIAVAKTQAHADPTVGIYGGRDEGNRLVGVNVSIPLFVRNNYQAGVGEANHEFASAEETRMDVYRQARANLQGTWERYHITLEAFSEWQSTTAQSIKDGEVLLNRLWEAGELSTTDYLIQLKQIIDSRAAGAELQGKAWQAWFDWLNASDTLDNWLESNDAINGSK